jgi:tRNA-dihydrouridine synthase
MAPLLAFTDCTYREVYFKHFTGIDRAVSPFIVVSENSHYKMKSVQSLIPELHESIPVEPQILAKDPYAFAALVTLLEDVGFQSVNLNLGCPATSVVNKGRGSGLLPYPDQIRKFLEICLSKIRIPLSIKLRTGLYSHQEIYPVIDVLNDFTLSEVIIHPRLGINKYEGPVNLEIMDDILGKIQAPVVYNGDVSRLTFNDLKKRFPFVSRWMIGRELLKDPFLASDIKKGLTREAIDEERKVLIKNFHDDLLQAFVQRIEKEEALVGKMKSYWHYMESLFPGKNEETLSMKKILKLCDYEKIINRIFED